MAGSYRLDIRAVVVLPFDVLLCVVRVVVLGAVVRCVLVVLCVAAVLPRCGCRVAVEPLSVRLPCCGALRVTVVRVLLSRLYSRPLPPSFR